MTAVSVLLLRPDAAITRLMVGSPLTHIEMVIFVPRLVPSVANKTRVLVELSTVSTENTGVLDSSVSPLSSLALLLLSVNSSNWLGLFVTH